MCLMIMGFKCECIVTDEGSDVLEIKNIATVPDYQGKGYAKSLIDFIVEKYREQICYSTSRNR